MVKFTQPLLVYQFCEEALKCHYNRTWPFCFEENCNHKYIKQVIEKFYLPLKSTITWQARANCPCMHIVH